MLLNLLQFVAALQKIERAEFSLCPIRFYFIFNVRMPLPSNEGLTLSQYIVFSLAQQTKLPYTIKPVPENEISQQRTAFASLLQSLGKASFEEIEQTLQERETVEPEAGLTPEVIEQLRKRIKN